MLFIVNIAAGLEKQNFTNGNVFKTITNRYNKITGEK